MVVEVAIFTVKEGQEEKALGIFNAVKALKEKQPGYQEALVKKSALYPRRYLIYSAFDSWDNLGAMREAARLYMKEHPLQPYLEGEPIYDCFQ
jgi:heme-degrading monooxygenase HmoA